MAFDISKFAETLGAVSESDTKPAQIEYIDIDLLDGDTRNFYQIAKVEDLAANIQLFGLQQPLRVRRGDGGRYIIVSGHRRRAALQKLVEDGMEQFRQVPCIQEREEGSEALQELRLIFANSDTRQLTSAELSKQAERVEALLYQLKEEGYEFPGRMRDHVAEACKVSKTKLARLKVIRDNLLNEWRPAYEKGDLPESCAYSLAQLPADHQLCIWDGTKSKNQQVRYLYQEIIKNYGEKLAAVDHLICKRGPRTGFPCSNIDKKRRQVVNQSGWYGSSSCSKCCDKCSELATCKNACPLLAEKVKKLKADASAQRKQEKVAQEEKDRPVISQIMKFWQRFGEARNAADKSVKQYYNAVGKYYSSEDEEKTWKLECLEAKFTTFTNLPYGYSCTLDDVQRYVKVADLFGCSLDYLLCRTDDPKGFAASSTGAPAAESPAPARWVPGSKKPEQAGQLAVGCFMADGMETPMRTIVCWQKGQWCFPTGATIDMDCVAWYPLPKEDDYENA